MGLSHKASRTLPLPPVGRAISDACPVVVILGAGDLRTAGAAARVGLRSLSISRNLSMGR